MVLKQVTLDGKKAKLNKYMISGKFDAEYEALRPLSGRSEYLLSVAINDAVWRVLRVGGLQDIKIDISDIKVVKTST